MLLPKRSKYRRVHRGRMTGRATRGNKVAYRSEEHTSELQSLSC